ncbi:MAG TPA: tetratricopeptide repeat protein [Acetobacteraceae bacterium]|nr:tetratricopeptide repeat protein [Acetobacteraceae bacterium]
MSFFDHLHRAALPRLTLGLALGLALVAAMVVAAPPARAGTAAPGPSAGVDADFVAGGFALSQGNPGIAAGYFSHALARRPGDPVLLRRAFDAALMSGSPEALRLAARLPGNDAAVLLLAGTDARAGRWAAAEQRIATLPHDGQAGLLRPVLLAWAEQGAGRTDQALATLAPLVAEPHAPGFYLLHAGMIADLAGRTAEAAQLFQRAEAALGPGDLRTTLIFASFDLRHGHRALALRRLDSLSSDTPEFSIALPALAASLGHLPVATAVDGMAEAFLGLGATLQAAARPESALLMLRLALAVRPDFAAARLLAAELLGDQHKSQHALALLAGIAVNDPLAPVATLQAADLLRGMGRTDAALHRLAQLERLFPKNPLPFGEAGDILRDTHHPHAAVAAYTHALANAAPLAARDWVLLYNRGIAYDDAHDWTHAEADFHAALRLVPDQPLVLNYLGYSWADRGIHLADAQRMIETAARADPDSAAITDSLGWVLLRRHDIARAVTTEQRAAELAPEDATINGHLGDVYWAAGRKLEARYQWERALTLKPEPAEAARLRARLRQDQDAAMVHPPAATAKAGAAVPATRLR